MSYYFSKAVQAGSFEQAVEMAKAAVKEAGFGVVSEIDMRKTFDEKLNIKFKPYTIIGACNPQYAYKAVGLEPKIGLFLPCNFLVEEEKAGEYTISGIDPVEMMLAIENDQLILAAYEIRDKIKKVIDAL